MSGWIKLDKALIDTIKFRRVVKAVRNSNALRSVTDVSDSFAVTVVLGALVRLWIYADTHIADDDTLAITIDEINDLVGVEGFAQALPVEWLQVIDPDHVQLPDFHAHNGSSEKLRRNNARRQADYRHRHKQHNVTRDVTDSNSHNDARREEIRPEKKRPEENKSALAPNVSRETDSVEDLFAKSLEEWKHVDGVSVEAGEAWIRFCASELNPPKPLAGLARISMAKTLLGMGDAANQRGAVDFCIANGFRNLRIADGNAAKGGGKRSTKSADRLTYKPDPEEEQRARAGLRPAAGGA